MIELLDFIAERLDPVDPIHAEARDWIKRVRNLHERQIELKEKAIDAFDAGDDDACMSAVAEHDRVSDELKAICARQQSVIAALRTSAETLQ